MYVIESFTDEYPLIPVNGAYSFFRVVSLIESRLMAGQGDNVWQWGRILPENEIAEPSISVYWITFSSPKWLMYLTGKWVIPEIWMLVVT